MSTVTNELSPTPEIWADPLPRPAGVVKEWTRAVAPYLAARCIHRLFEAQAVSRGGQPPAHRERDGRSNRRVRLGGHMAPLREVRP